MLCNLKQTFGKAPEMPGAEKRGPYIQGPVSRRRGKGAFKGVIRILYEKNRIKASARIKNYEICIMPTTY